MGGPPPRAAGLGWMRWGWGIPDQGVKVLRFNVGLERAEQTGARVPRCQAERDEEPNTSRSRRWTATPSLPRAPARPSLSLWGMGSSSLPAFIGQR